MTPKEKALELVDRQMMSIIINIKQDIEACVINAAKQCALICVDEILSQFNWKPSAGLSYWQEVKSEIHKL